MEKLERMRKHRESMDWNGMLVREYRTLIDAATSGRERKRLTDELERNLRPYDSGHPAAGKL